MQVLKYLYIAVEICQIKDKMPTNTQQTGIHIAF
jgi:hypothetical protein